MAVYEIDVEGYILLRKRKRSRASFTTSVDGLTVTFTDTSTRSPSAWTWDFGDGSPLSVEQNPEHTYAEAGTYTVTLHAFNRAGQSKPFTADVTVEGGAATWDDAVSALNPLYWAKLDEASGNFANSGSVGGTFTAAGTPGYRAGSLTGVDAGIGCENGDGFAVGSPARATVTSIFLVRTPVTLTQVNYADMGGGVFFLRVLSDGTLRIYDDLDLFTLSSAAGVVTSNQWNLIAFTTTNVGTCRIFHTSQTANGVVSEVASAAGLSVDAFSSAAIRVSSSSDTAILGALVVTNTALTLSDIQALADTLDWS